MLGIWFSIAQVVISGYQPIAEQTWVALNPEYYPLNRQPPAIFVAWRGNQFPVIAQKKQGKRWQLLFPVRLMPPFELFEGQAQVSKAYLARLKRIDEMAYGVAGIDKSSEPSSYVYQDEQSSERPLAFISEFNVPNQDPTMASRRQLAYQQQWREPLLLALVQTHGHGKINRNSEGNQENTTLTLSVAWQQDKAQICHHVVQGETLWRIANALSQQQGVDTYSYLLALAAVNQRHLGNTIKVKTGMPLYCPSDQLVAQYDALSPLERRARFAQLEQGL